MCHLWDEAYTGAVVLYLLHEIRQTLLDARKGLGGRGYEIHRTGR